MKIADKTKEVIKMEWVEVATHTLLIVFLLLISVSLIVLLKKEFKVKIPHNTKMLADDRAEVERYKRYSEIFDINEIGKDVYKNG